MMIQKQWQTKSRWGFTLIELLIVVAIIAILAAIAVPNFMEAQTRSKVSRCKADMRSISVAMESYIVDHNTYPYDAGIYQDVGGTIVNTLMLRLTTPVSYVTSIFEDVFNPGAGFAVETCNNVYVLGAHTKFGRNYAIGKFGQDGNSLDWELASLGPDRLWGTTYQEAYGGQDGDMVSCLYDPTNGTVSWGNIFRTNLGSAN